MCLLPWFRPTEPCKNTELELTGDTLSCDKYFFQSHLWKPPHLGASSRSTSFKKCYLISYAHHAYGMKLGPLTHITTRVRLMCHSSSKNLLIIWGLFSFFQKYQIRTNVEKFWIIFSIFFSPSSWTPVLEDGHLVVHCLQGHFGIKVRREPISYAYAYEKKWLFFLSFFYKKIFTFHRVFLRMVFVPGCA